MNHNFGEKLREYSKKQGKEVNVWQTPKYEVSRKKACEMIDSGKYGLEDGDFWILMNETTNESMAYTGLITSHNACLKINDSLPEKDRFVPSCVTIDKDGYGNSLVYTYINDSQGIYEVGEVARENCKQSYPYAMAFKRLFDRVVLKLSKLAYAGVYSEAEADEFRDPIDERPKESSFIGEAKAKELGKELIAKNVNIEKLCEQKNVPSLSKLTVKQYEEIKAQLAKAS